MNGTGSSLVQRFLLAARAGLSFRGQRDYYEVFGYKRTLMASDMLAKYDRQDLTQRVVDTGPEATWAYPPTPEAAAGAIAAWDTLKEIGLLSAILQADRLLAFDTFSVIMLGLPGKPELPINSAKLEDIKYITAHGAGCVTISNYDNDTSSPRFGLPTIYLIRIDRPGIPASADSTGIKVHWTRIVHVIDPPLQGRMFSKPRLAPMFNLLDDILKVSGSGAETYWLTANRGIQVDVDKEMSFGPDDAAALDAEVQEYQHQMRRVLRTRGVKVNNLGSDVADPSGTFGVLMGLLAAVSGIPQRILMGAEAGQLASEQDRANWSEYLSRRRTIFAEPYLLRPLFLRLEGLTILAKDSAVKITYAWPEAFHQNPLEKSMTMSAKARALINLSRQSQYGTPYVGLKEGREWLDLPPDLPAGDSFPMAAAPASGSKKIGGDKKSGGAGGNDGSGDSGGGAQEPTTIPASDGTGDPASN